MSDTLHSGGPESRSPFGNEVRGYDSRGRKPRVPVQIRSAANSGTPPSCLSCGRPARLSNEDGCYCVDCMKLLLLEKMLVQINLLCGPRRESDL
jgi:hypothetical protein